MNETWIGPSCWLLPPLPLPPPGGWLDMEVEALGDVPGFIERGREEEGIRVQVIAKGQKVGETVPAVEDASPGLSNDPRKNQKDGCRRRTTDGNPSLFWTSAGPARASASPRPKQ